MILHFTIGAASVPARSRTRNVSLGPRSDLRFTIGTTQRKAWDSNPQPRQGRPASNGVARQFACLPSPVESPGVAPGPPPRQGGVLLLDHDPMSRSLAVDPPGVEPGSPPRDGGVVPLDHGPVLCQWTAEESHPDLLVAGQASCCWTSSPQPRTRGPLGTRTRTASLPRRR